MKHYSAWVEITGKVFVDEYELAEKLGLETETELDSVDLEKVQDAFEEIAREKLWALFPTDEPMKCNELIVDMKTFQ